MGDQGASSNSFSSTSLLFLDWVKKAFPLEVGDSLKSNEGQACLLTNTSTTMAHPYLGEAEMLSNLEVVRQVLSAKADPRSKELLVIVKGSGGGKSRLLEELRRRLNEDNGTLTIGITFNTHSCYEPSELFIAAEDRLALNLMLTVMCRVTAVVCGNRIEDHYRPLLDALADLDIATLHQPAILANLFRTFLIYCLSAIETSGKFGEVANFVFLVDEIIRLRDKNSPRTLSEEQRQSVNDQFAMFLSALNQAVLNEPLQTGLNCALVISSLEVLRNKTDSDRFMQVLTFPRIESESVVDKWWHIDNSSVVKTHQLQLAAETLKNIPRFLEFAKSSLTQDDADVSAMLRGLYQTVFNCIPPGYNVTNWVSPAKNFALVFGKSIKIDEECTSLIRSSFFTNSVSELGEDGSIVPEANIVMLAHFNKRQAPADQPICLDWNLPGQIYFNVFESITQTISKDGAEGDVLETAAVGWLQARIIAAMQTSMKYITVDELLGVEEGVIADVIEKDEEEEVVPIEIKLPKLINSKYPVFSQDCDNFLKSLPKISENPAEFASQFNEAVYFSKGSTIVIYQTAAGQNFDLMTIALTRGSTGHFNRHFVTFFDMKSKQTVDPNSSSQFEWVEKFVAELKNLKQNGTALSPISEALVCGSYRFVYLTAYPTVSLCRSEVTASGRKSSFVRFEHPERLIVMNAVQSQTFFSVIWDFYKFARSMKSDKSTEGSEGVQTVNLSKSFEKRHTNSVL